MKTFLGLLSLAATALVAVGQGSSSVASSDLKSVVIVQPETPREFPESLARAYPGGGHAKVLLTVGSDGQLKESLLTSYSARPFGSEALESLKEWKFRPARWMNEPITACVEVTLRFQTSGTLVSYGTPAEYMEATQAKMEERGVYRAFTPAELDRLPAVLQSVKPIYPKSLADRGVLGAVTVDFYLDEQGVVRMPSISSQTLPELSEAAVRAIREWKFEPPLRGGKPVLARLQQTFNFTPATAVAGGI